MVKKRAGTFSISSITSDLDAMTIRRDPQGASDSFQVDVKFVPPMLHPGEMRGNIRIHTSDPAFPEFVVPIRLDSLIFAPLRTVQAISYNRPSANYLLGSLSYQSDFS
jgi:hypothetical protein